MIEDHNKTFSSKSEFSLVNLVKSETKLNTKLITMNNKDNFKISTSFVFFSVKDSNTQDNFIENKRIYML